MLIKFMYMVHNGFDHLQLSEDKSIKFGHVDPRDTRAYYFVNGCILYKHTSSSIESMTKIN